MKKFNGEIYASPYFFASRVFAEANFACIELTTPHRHGDKKLLKALSAFRNGKPDQEDLDYINTRVVREENVPDSCIRIYTRNALVDEENEYRLSILEGKRHRYIARVSGMFKPSDAPFPEILSLKVGARVILGKNIGNGLCNGMAGTITVMHRDSVEVRFDRG